jgi:hypothetical protein
MSVMRQRYAAVQDLQGLGATDAVVGVVRRPELEPGRRLGPDRASAIDETLLDPRDLGEVEMDRGEPAGRQPETQPQGRRQGEGLAEFGEREGLGLEKGGHVPEASSHRPAGSSRGASLSLGGRA